jgi:glycosyltransferase involved in cell wall biosynthesis
MVADNWNSFAEALDELLDNPDRRRALASDAVKHVQDCYSVSAWRPTVEELVDQAVKRVQS